MARDIWETTLSELLHSDAIKDALQARRAFCYLFERPQGER